MTDPYHIVVVEDDAVTRTKLAGYAQTAGHRVSEAEDGDGMWRILERDAADLILLDINLPREDGLDLTRKLRAQSNVGIILVTVRDEEVDRIVGLEIGADDYIRLNSQTVGTGGRMVPDSRGRSGRWITSGFGSGSRMLMS